MGNVAWTRIIIAGWPVLSILFIGSIITFAVLFDRWKAFGNTKVDPGPFLNSIKRDNDPDKILKWCGRSDQPLAVITRKVYEGGKARDGKERILHRTIQSLVQKLETHVSILGTIASVAPFVGLLGTVIGIIKAFRAVSVSATGGPSVVALGIAEALVGTAGGLVVAIPALLAYNYFVNKIRHLTQDWELAGGEIIDLAIEAEKG